MKKVLQYTWNFCAVLGIGLSILILYTYWKVNRDAEFVPMREFVLPPPPVLSLENLVKEFKEEKIGFELHPNIVRKVTKDGEWPIYYIGKIITGASETHKYLLTQIGLLQPNHAGHFTLVFRCKNEFKEWEEFEIYNAHTDLEPMFEESHMNVQRIREDEFSEALEKRKKWYNKALERNAE